MNGNAAPAGVSGGRPDLAAPADVPWIVRRLEQAGFSTWAVGGAVRDALVGRRPGDWDLTTAARPADVRRIFKRTVPVGVEHGTVGVLGRDGRMYEVTTFRRDVETDGRHARVSFADTVEEDLQRRDFTINAVAWHPITRDVCDPHGGRGDLSRGVLRTVGSPEERFREDRLRVLRALRFAGRFGLRVDDDTWRAAVGSAHALHALSAERVREELFKLLREVRRPSDALRLYQESGVLGALYPELEACVGLVDRDGEGVWTHLLRTCDLVPENRWRLRLSALLHDVGKGVVVRAADGSFPEHAAAGGAVAGTVLRRLKCSNSDTDRVVHLVAQHGEFPDPEAPEAELRRWVRLVGKSFLADLFRLRRADLSARQPVPEAGMEALLVLRRRVGKIIAARVPLEITDLAIGGAELAELGIPRGPLYGEILRDLLERVTDEPELNTRTGLMEVVRNRIG